MNVKQLVRARAYTAPKSDNLGKFADLLGREAGVDDLTLVKENAGWVLMQHDRRLSAAYSKDEVVACVTGFIAGLRSAKQS